MFFPVIFTCWPFHPLFKIPLATFFSGPKLPLQIPNTLEGFDFFIYFAICLLVISKLVRHTIRTHTKDRGTVDWSQWGSKANIVSQQHPLVPFFSTSCHIFTLTHFSFGDSPAQKHPWLTTGNSSSSIITPPLFLKLPSVNAEHYNAPPAKGATHR